MGLHFTCKLDSSVWNFQLLLLGKLGLKDVQGHCEFSLGVIVMSQHHHGYKSRSQSWSCWPLESEWPLLKIEGAHWHEAPNIRRKLFQLPKMSRRQGLFRDFIIPHITDIFSDHGRTIYHSIPSKYPTTNLKILPLF